MNIETGLRKNDRLGISNNKMREHHLISEE